LIASDDAVHQFLKLLHQFGGPSERARWEALHERLTIHPSPTAGVVDGEYMPNRTEITTAVMTDRVRNLEKVRTRAFSGTFNKEACPERSIMLAIKPSSGSCSLRNAYLNM
jgi:hypothetical protein